MATSQEEEKEEEEAAAPPHILIHPEGMVALPGQKIHLKCGAINAELGTWTINNIPLQSEANIAIYEENGLFHLKISSAAFIDAGIYRCRVMNKNGANYSNAAQISFKQPSSAFSINNGLFTPPVPSPMYSRWRPQNLMPPPPPPPSSSPSFSSSMYRNWLPPPPPPASSNVSANPVPPRTVHHHHQQQQKPNANRGTKLCLIF
jgi:hypothetical protein